MEKSMNVNELAEAFSKLARVIIPEPYRRPQKVLKPLSFKEINEALDEAAENQEKKKRHEQ